VTVTAEEFQERKIEVYGWPVNITSYRLGVAWHAKADNVSPGAALARASGASREEAEQKIIARAGQLLGRTKRQTT
jgi:hypothetical protein